MGWIDMRTICAICRTPCSDKQKIYFVEFWDRFRDMVCYTCICKIKKHPKCRGEVDALFHKKYFGYKKYMVDMRKRNYCRWLK